MGGTLPGRTRPRLRASLQGTGRPHARVPPRTRPPTARPPRPRGPRVPGPGVGGRERPGEPGPASPAPAAGRRRGGTQRAPPLPPRPAWAVIHAGGGPGYPRGPGRWVRPGYPGRTSAPPPRGGRSLDPGTQSVGGIRTLHVRGGPAALPAQAGATLGDKVWVPGFGGRRWGGAGRTKPVRRVCGQVGGGPPPAGSREQRPSVCSGAEQTMAPEFYPWGCPPRRRVSCFSVISQQRPSPLTRGGDPF